MKCLGYLIVCFFVASSCRKKEMYSTRWKCGTYIWEYSFYNGNVINSENENRKFAIEIKKNGKVEIYEDQKLIDFGRSGIKDANSIATRNGYLNVQINTDNINFSINFPFDKYNNYFKKVK